MEGEEEEEVIEGNGGFLWWKEMEKKLGKWVFGGFEATVLMLLVVSPF